MIQSIRIGIVFLVAIAAPVVLADEPQPAPAVVLNAAGGYGEVIPDDVKPEPLSAALARLDAGAEAIEGVFRGRVGKVCQKQGCWLQLIDGEQMARVMTRHVFFVPKDLSGEAIVSGTLKRVTLDEKEASHLARESGEDFDPTASRVEYRITARGVAIVK